MDSHHGGATRCARLNQWASPRDVSALQYRNPADLCSGDVCVCACVCCVRETSVDIGRCSQVYGIQAPQRQVLTCRCLPSLVSQTHLVSQTADLYLNLRYYLLSTCLQDAIVERTDLAGRRYRYL